MKRFCLLTGLLILNFCTTIAQTIQPPCELNKQVNNVVMTADSLSGFFRNMQETLNSDNWNAFQTAVRNNAGLTAFDQCGQYRDQFRNMYIMIGKDLSQQFDQLIRAVDPERKMPERDVLRRMDEAYNCYFNSDAGTTLPAFMLKNFSTLNPKNNTEKAMGPCERAAKTCLNTARRNYHAALRQCVSAGAGIGGLISGWLGAGVGLVCAIQASNDELRDVFDCLETFEACIAAQ